MWSASRWSLSRERISRRKSCCQFVVMACLMAARSIHNPTLTNSIIMVSTPPGLDWTQTGLDRAHSVPRLDWTRPTLYPDWTGPGPHWTQIGLDQAHTGLDWTGPTLAELPFLTIMKLPALFRTWSRGDGSALVESFWRCSWISLVALCCKSNWLDPGYSW